MRTITILNLLTGHVVTFPISERLLFHLCSKLGVFLCVKLPSLYNRESSVYPKRIAAGGRQYLYSVWSLRTPGDHSWAAHGSCAQLPACNTPRLTQCPAST